MARKIEDRLNFLRVNPQDIDPKRHIVIETSFTYAATFSSSVNDNPYDFGGYDQSSFCIKAAPSYASSSEVFSLYADIMKSHSRFGRPEVPAISSSHNEDPVAFLLDFLTPKIK